MGGVSRGYLSQYLSELKGGFLDKCTRETNIRHLGLSLYTVSASYMNAESPDFPPLIFTSAAARKVSDLIAEEGNANLMLRVYIQGGGCSGFQYGFTFEEAVQDGDTEVVTEGVTLLVDPMSLQYLTGAEIDYMEGLQGAQFVIRNPNATTSCGCGSSFSV